MKYKEETNKEVMSYPQQSNPNVCAEMDSVDMQTAVVMGP